MKAKKEININLTKTAAETDWLQYGRLIKAGKVEEAAKLEEMELITLTPAEVKHLLKASQSMRTKQFMRKLLFITEVFFTLLLTRPTQWQWQWRKLKEQYNHKNKY